MRLLRGEVYFVKVGPTCGREINSKIRPVIIVSINDINSKPLVVTVIPGTTYDRRKPVFNNQVVIEPTDENGLANATLFDCIQIKALDHSRFNQPRVGVISSGELEALGAAIRLCLGLG